MKCSSSCSLLPRRSRLQHPGRLLAICPGRLPGLILASARLDRTDGRFFVAAYVATPRQERYGKGDMYSDNEPCHGPLPIEHLLCFILPMWVAVITVIVLFGERACRTIRKKYAEHHCPKHLCLST
jgi:hypothetical protein